MTLEARRLAERSEQVRRLTGRHLRVLAAIVMTFGVAVVALVVFDRSVLIFPATAVAFVAVDAADRWRRRAGQETVAGVEEWYVRNGPPCVCGCARSAHQGISSGFRSQGFWSYSFFDGVCSNPDCPGCTDGYRPGDGQPYKDLFPPEHVYRTGRDYHHSTATYRGPLTSVSVLAASILDRPETFDRVDRVKHAVGQPVLPGDDRLWILGGPLVVVILVGGDTVGTVTVPRGFVTDGASVPWFAQLVTGWRPWDEPQRWGAIVHDWLYCCNGRSVADHPDLGTLPAAAKPYADQAFRAVLAAAGAHPLRARTMYWAVHLFGGHAYTIDQDSGPTVRV